MSRALFFGGVPTRMDVERLLAEITAEPGTSATYDKVSNLIGVDYKSHRFQSVTIAWRKHLFQTRGLRVLCEAGAFHFLTAPQALQAGLRDYRRVGRAVGRAIVRTKAIDGKQLSAAEREKQRQAIRMGEELLEAAQRGMKAIAPPKAISSNVRVLRAGENGDVA